MPRKIETPFKKKFNLNDSPMRKAIQKLSKQEQLDATEESQIEEPKQQEQAEESVLENEFSPGKLDHYMVKQSSQKVEMENFIKLKQIEIEKAQQEVPQADEAANTSATFGTQIDFGIIEKLKQQRLAMLSATGQKSDELEANLDRDQIISKIQAEIKTKYMSQ